MADKHSISDPKINEILDLWFSEQVRPLWFNATTEFDQRLRDRFLLVYHAAAAGDLDNWRQIPKGALALIILLDQIPLNIFRHQPESFSTEAISREIAEHMIDSGFDMQLTDAQKAFVYMPFMHSEDLHDQDRSVALYEKAGLNYNLKFALHHREIVRRFGRFPHRNALLGRQSTPQELDYLQSDSAFNG
ncbi:MAG: DUF924 family protein [Gammaproteobacteria bacterium]|nr:MAG: DUF924 family protein [Gammaproteobacteria bacterium]